MKKIILSLCCFSFLIGIQSCEENGYLEDEINPSNIIGSTSEMVQLGEKVKNPYSLSVMQAAYDELVGDVSLRSATMLEPTHLYIRFLPKDIEELRVLENDSNLILYSYPLDVKIVEGGGNYHDPSLPDSVPTYQYVCVPVDYKLPQVEHEILDEIFFLDDEKGETSLRSSQKISWSALEEKAYAMVGDTLPVTEIRSSQWRAGGTIYYYDNSKNQTEPMSGVPVRMRYYVVTYQSCTDLEGRFSCETSRRGDCEYSIKWRRDPFRIRPVSGSSTAEFTIKTATSTISYTFHPSNNETQWYHASIFRAAHYIYYGNLYGLIRPEDNLEIRASNSSSDGSKFGNYTTSGSTEIHIYRYVSGITQNSLIYYGSTVHELAHSIHCNLVGKDTYESIREGKFKEAWTVGVSNYFVGKKYNSPLLLFYHDDYIGLVDDLLDNHVFNVSYCGDYVSGYTLSQVQNALRNSRSYEDFRYNIKLIKNNLYENEKIDRLFNHWANF